MTVHARTTKVVKSSYFGMFRLGKMLTLRSHAIVLGIFRRKKKEKKKEIGKEGEEEEEDEEGRTQTYTIA